MPDGLHAVAVVIEDMTVLDAATGREEAADDAGDVAADVERFRIVHADALHAEAEAADARVSSAKIHILCGICKSFTRFFGKTASIYDHKLLRS